MSSDNLQLFFQTSQGQFAVLIVILIFYLLIIFNGKKKKIDLKILAISAILIALSIVFSQITLFRMPQGGSITAFSMLPVVICGYLYGLRIGVMCGICVGLLNLVISPFIIHPLQLFFDYPFAFGALGLSGFFAHKKFGLIKGYLLGISARYFFSVISGILFFASYTPENFNPVTWSLFYNITYIGIEGALTLVILSLPTVRKAIDKMRF
jgi:thiamine transporter